MFGAISDKTRSTAEPPTTGENFIPATASSAKVAEHEIHAGNGIHGQYVRRHDLARAADDPRRILAPTAGRRAQVHASNARPQQPLGLLDLLQLEHRARSPTFPVRPFDELVVRVLGEPSSAALCAFGHCGSMGLSGLTSLCSAPIMPGMHLSEKQKKHLRRLAHPMHPIVMLGNAGLTDGVVNELERALTDHELVKVGADVGERDARNALDSLADRTASALVQRVWGMWGYSIGGARKCRKFSFRTNSAGRVERRARGCDACVARVAMEWLPRACAQQGQRSAMPEGRGAGAPSISSGPGRFAGGSLSTPSAGNPSPRLSRSALQPDCPPAHPTQTSRPRRVAESSIRTIHRRM